MNKQLSTRLKRIDLPKIIERDGFDCFYCGTSLQRVTWIYEHLNDDPADNRIENIVLACQSCNNKKPHSPEMKQKALEKKKENESNNYTRRGAREVPSPSLKPELDINRTNFEITNQHLLEVVSTDGQIEFKVALDSCVMLCRLKTNTGSQTAVRRYIDALVSRVGPFMVVQNDQKERVIVRRDGN